jgi:hypothetical protein
MITLCLWRITRIDRQSRDANLHLMRKIEDELLEGDDWIPPDKRDRDSSFPRKIRVGTPTTHLAAGTLYNVFYWVLAGTDILAATLCAFGFFSG